MIHHLSDSVDLYRSWTPRIHRLEVVYYERDTTVSIFYIVIFDSAMKNILVVATHPKISSVKFETHRDNIRLAFLIHRRNSSEAL